MAYSTRNDLFIGCDFDVTLFHPATIDLQSSGEEVTALATTIFGQHPTKFESLSLPINYQKESDTYIPPNETTEELIAKLKTDLPFLEFPDSLYPHLFVIRRDKTHAKIVLFRPKGTVLNLDSTTETTQNDAIIFNPDFYEFAFELVSSVECLSQRLLKPFADQQQQNLGLQRMLIILTVCFGMERPFLRHNFICHILNIIKQRKPDEIALISDAEHGATDKTTLFNIIFSEFIKKNPQAVPGQRVLYDDFSQYKQTCEQHKIDFIEATGPQSLHDLLAAAKVTPAMISMYVTKCINNLRKDLSEKARMEKIERLLCFQHDMIARRGKTFLFSSSVKSPAWAIAHTDKLIATCHEDSPYEYHALRSPIGHPIVCSISYDIARTQISRTERISFHTASFESALFTTGQFQKDSSEGFAEKITPLKLNALIKLPGIGVLVSPISIDSAVIAVYQKSADHANLVLHLVDFESQHVTAIATIISNANKLSTFTQLNYSLAAIANTEKNRISICLATAVEKENLAYLVECPLQGNAASPILPIDKAHLSKKGVPNTPLFVCAKALNADETQLAFSLANNNISIFSIAREDKSLPMEFFPTNADKEEVTCLAFGANTNTLLIASRTKTLNPLAKTKAFITQYTILSNKAYEALRVEVDLEPRDKVISLNCDASGSILSYGTVKTFGQITFT